VLAARQYNATDRDHIHIADGLADDGKSVVTDFAVRDEVVRPDEIARVDAALRNELVDVNRSVDSKAMFSSSSFDISM
jgi:hypothetical protein